MLPDCVHDKPSRLQYLIDSNNSTCIRDADIKNVQGQVLFGKDILQQHNNNSMTVVVVHENIITCSTTIPLVFRYSSNYKPNVSKGHTCHLVLARSEGNVCLYKCVHHDTHGISLTLSSWFYENAGGILCEIYMV